MRTSCRALYLHYLLFMGLASSPKARANIQKANKPMSMSVTQKLIRLALVDLCHEKMTAMHGTWYTLDAIHELLYTRSDVDDETLWTKESQQVS
jgi:hypothetical protein